MKHVDCKPTMICSVAVFSPYAVMKVRGSDTNPKAGAVVSPCRLLCGGMTLPSVRMESDSTFYDVLHIIISLLSPFCLALTALENPPAIIPLIFSLPFTEI